MTGAHTWVKSWLLAALPVHPRDAGLPAPLRARAGDALAALGDPRFDPDRFHLPRGADLGFAAVPVLALEQIRCYLPVRQRFWPALVGGGVWRL